MARSPGYKIDKMDYEHLYFDVPETNINGLTARIYQSKPLVTLEPEIKDIIEAQATFSIAIIFQRNGSAKY